MEPVDVTAHWDDQGRVTPKDFTWKGVRHLVESTGRSWKDTAGFHVLVMAPGGKVFELFFQVPELKWYLAQHSQHPTII